MKSDSTRQLATRAKDAMLTYINIKIPTTKLPLFRNHGQPKQLLKPHY